MTNLDSLPPELIHEIMHHLSIRALLAFGLTSKIYHRCQSMSLSTLRLGVFQSRLSGIASLMESSEERSSIHSVQVILPRSESRTKSMTVRNQNNVIECVVKRYRHSLRDLEIALWELSQGTARSIAQMENLRHLAIRLDHPHTRHTGVDRNFWRTSPGSTVWNVLSNELGHNSTNRSCHGRLQSLALERAGITDYQLQKILERNPSITDLRLQKCLLLTQETFEYLANSSHRCNLKVLHFTQSTSSEIDNRLLPYIEMLSKLDVSIFKASNASTAPLISAQVLSLHNCINIDSRLARQINEDIWHVPQFILPCSLGDSEGVVEVDPEYR